MLVPTGPVREWLTEGHFPSKQPVLLLVVVVACTTTCRRDAFALYFYGLLYCFLLDPKCDTIIEKLLAVRDKKPGTTVQLSNDEVDFILEDMLPQPVGADMMKAAAFGHLKAAIISSRYI